METLRNIEIAISQTTIDNTEPRWTNRARKAIQSCMSFIESSTSPHKISQELWKRKCTLGNIAVEAGSKCDMSSESGFNKAACLVMWAARYIEETTYARDLRLSMGVAEDEKMVHGCPSLN